jgi:hypothetical protein
MAQFNYYIGPWVATVLAGRKVWAPPVGTAGAIDLAPLSDQAISPASTTQRRVGFFAVAGLLGSDYALLGSGDCRSIPVTAAMRSAWKSIAGYNASGDVLADLLYDNLTDGSDPDGASGPLPLVPDNASWLTVMLPGHSPIRSARFEWGKPDSRGRGHFAKLRQLIRAQFQARWAINQSVARKCLDYECDKYGLQGAADWKDLVPPALLKDVPGRLKHATTYDDTFPADVSDITSGGEQLTWGAYDAGGGTAPTFNVVSGKIGKSSSTSQGSDFARAEHDLSSADHYAQLAMSFPSGSTGFGGGSYHGPAIRCSTTNFYAFQWSVTDGSTYLLKILSGSQTTLTTGSFGAAADGDTVKINASGSTLSGYRNASLNCSTTDTSITGNLRGGYSQYGGSLSQCADNFEASDGLGGGGGGILYTQLERGTRGLVRGTYGGSF